MDGVTAHPRPAESGVANHPAVVAWRRLGTGMPKVQAVAGVERHPRVPKSSVYRLHVVGESGAAVIAKQCERQYGEIERTIYELVLPHLPVSYPRFLGMAEDDDGLSCWLFIEDAGDEAYSPNISQHRTMAGRWLAAMHSSATLLPSLSHLPDRSPTHYLRHLRSAKDSIRENLHNPALNKEQQRHLQRIVSRCQFVEHEWQRVEQFCRGMPETLVHGDFVGKNVRLRSDATGTEILPFDWEHAGRGVPAVDLAQAAFPSTTFLANPDLDAYCAAVQWDSLRSEAVQLLAVYGTVFRCLAALHWESRRLAYEWVEWPVKNMILYEAELVEAVKAAGWSE